MRRNDQIPDTGRKHVVLVAYYFPPLGGSGVQRVAKWAKYLPQNGWDVTVLTVEPGAYFAFDESLLDEVREAGVRIVRTRTLDPTRISRWKKQIKQPSEPVRKLFGWVTGFFFLPDNKRGWRRFARRAFSEIVANGPIHAVLSSAPPYTSLMVGDELATHLGVPHVLDYRDDWVSNPRNSFPTALHRRWHVKAERTVVSKAAKIVTINEGMAALLRERHVAADIRILPQGFDPADFEGINRRRPGGRIRLLYSGMFYDAQQPDTLLKAVGLLKERDTDLAKKLEICFVGLYPDEKRHLIKDLGLEEMVTMSGYKSHREAVTELGSADILWMIVGHQKHGHAITTGKLFEYMGTRLPILALAPEGEIRKALSGYGAAWIVDPDDTGEIATALATLVRKAEEGSLPVGDEEWVARFNREKQAGELADLLAEVS